MTEPKCCPLESLLKNISGQWTVSILWILETDGALRFGELGREANPSIRNLKAEWQR